MPERAPHGTFGRRLALAFASVAAFTAILSAILLTAVWNYQFDSYIRNNLQRDANAWAQLLSEGYAANLNWSPTWVANLPLVSPGRDYVLEAVDAKGNTILRDEGAGHMRLMGGTTPEITKQAVVAPIQANGEIVGTVRVWSTGPNQLASQFDQQFRQAAIFGLLAAAVVALGFASVGGWIYSRRLVRPIARITETAEALATGDGAARTGLVGDDEFGYLGRAFDEMADAIEADREMERRLTADVAHELRTPLQAIQATVEAMQDGVLPADEERLGVVRDETVRLARLADAILELTKLERGSMPFEMKRIDVADPLRAALDTHRALFETCDLALTATSIVSGIHVQGDPDRLQQAIGNLLSNAARYTPSGGSVDVSLSRVDGRALVQIADTGVGIAEEDLDKVFERFWRADDSRHRASGGLGIGLAVTREIVERHRGFIRAEARPGGGSIFTISLPTSEKLASEKRTRTTTKSAAEKRAPSTAAERA